MHDKLLYGAGRHMLPLPGPIWRGQIPHGSEHLAFMTEAQHRVRDYVVVELPRYAAPLPPAKIAKDLDMPPEQVAGILDELEKRLTFLFRDESGAVLWAYPVTAERTPHGVTFSTGEQLYAA